MRRSSSITAGRSYQGCVAVGIRLCGCVREVAVCHTVRKVVWFAVGHTALTGKTHWCVCVVGCSRSYCVYRYPCDLPVQVVWPTANHTNTV